MRLIDADNINFHCNYDGNCTGDIDDCKECGNYICDFRDIQEQPTAYDIDKVVEELDKKYNNSLWIKGDEEFSITRNELIEIVKQGGVSDDVCEWSLCDEEANVYDTSCRNPHILIKGTPKENNYEYCPYCGKKIKVGGENGC